MKKSIFSQKTKKKYKVIQSFLQRKLRLNLTINNCYILSSIKTFFLRNLFSRNKGVKLLTFCILFLILLSVEAMILTYYTMEIEDYKGLFIFFTMINIFFGVVVWLGEQEEV